MMWIIAVESREARLTTDNTLHKHGLISANVPRVSLSRHANKSASAHKEQSRPNLKPQYPRSRWKKSAFLHLKRSHCYAKAVLLISIVTLLRVTYTYMTPGPNLGCYPRRSRHSFGLTLSSLCPLCPQMLCNYLRRPLLELSTLKLKLDAPCPCSWRFLRYIATVVFERHSRPLVQSMTGCFRYKTSIFNCLLCESYWQNNFLCQFLATQKNTNAS